MLEMNKWDELQAAIEFLRKRVELRTLQGSIKDAVIGVEDAFEALKGSN